MRGVINSKQFTDAFVIEQLSYEDGVVLKASETSEDGLITQTIYEHIESGQRFQITLENVE